MKKILKIINSLLFVFFVCFMVYILVSSYNTLKLSKLLTVLCIFPLIMIPYLLDRLKWYHMNEALIFGYYLFLLLALVFGSILGVYYKIWWFDLFTHFLSGIMTSVLAYIILKENKIDDRKHKLFNFIFILTFTIAIAACWEYFEFTSDKLFNSDVQWVAKTGVDDTITDMLIATLGGILSVVYYLYYMHVKK